MKVEMMGTLQLTLLDYYQELKNRNDSDFTEMKANQVKWKGGDFFCGAGGVTSGIENTDIAEIIFAINHDHKAIETHKINNSKVHHFISDVRAVFLSSLKKYIGLDFLWMSAECTNYSIAKGGQSRDADSRSLCEELYRFAPYLKCNYIFLENVVEFMTWGPLIQKTDKNLNPMFDKKGNPIMIPDPKLKGIYYKQWVEKLKELGYVNYQYKVLNSADYGSPTSRKRYFAVFSREGFPIAFPVPTHDKHGRHGLKKWVACKDFINLQEEGQSIFGRKKPLAENTLKRVAYGIKKYCLSDLEKAFILKYYTGSDNQVSDIDTPLDTITTKDRHSVVNIEKNKFITQHIHKALNAQDMDRPLNTILTEDMKSLVTIERQPKAQFIDKTFSSEYSVQAINEPLSTIMTANKKSLVSLVTEVKKSAGIEFEKKQFIEKYFEPGWQTEFLHDLIADIKMRFLTAEELKLCQGFRKDYQLLGPEYLKKKYIGNSVPPQLAQALVTANYIAYHNRKVKAA
jgi:DNA (cytosine-5)-methyltransferase 1